MSRSRARIAALALLCALVASACQVSVGTEVHVGDDGAGHLAIRVVLDEDLASTLAQDDVDVFAGLDELPDGWSSERSSPDGGEAVTVRADFADPAGLERRVAQLREGLDAEDPLLLDGIQLAVAEDGSAQLSGRAGFRPPSSTGLRGTGVGFDGEDLAALLAERGDEVLRVDLRAAMPGPVVGGNADEVDGNVATWHLPTTELVDVRVASDPPSALQRWLAIGAAAVVGLVLALAVVGLVRRRR